MATTAQRAQRLVTSTSVGREHRLLFLFFTVFFLFLGQKTARRARETILQALHLSPGGWTLPNGGRKGQEVLLAPQPSPFRDVMPGIFSPTHSFYPKTPNDSSF